MNDFDNEIIEINNDESDTETKNINEPEKIIADIKPPKRSLKDKWRDLSKGKKALIITLSILVILVISAIIIYFTIIKDKEEENIVEEEPVILEKDNYRYENGNLVFLDLSEREIGQYTCENKDTEKCYVAKFDYTDDTFERILNVNEQNEEIEKSSPVYHNRYIFVFDGDIIHLYNMQTKEKEMDFQSIKGYANASDLVVVKDDKNLYGLLKIDENGADYLIRPSYDYLGIVNTKLNLLVAHDKNQTFIIDMNGQKLSSDIKANVMMVNEDFIVGIVNNTYNLYDYQYDELISDYDYIGLHDGVVSLVKGNRLYLMDKELNPLYVDGLRLENKDYVKKLVYDKDNKLVKTLESYSLEVKNNEVNITIGKDVNVINMLEGKISSKYNYINYFNGKLYLYSDLEKEDLLGTYECANRNNLTSENDTLENCIIYNKDNEYSGIYNNAYVFIKDSKDEDKYYLYDLNEKKNKGTYEELQFVNTEELNENIKPVYTSSSYIIAKSGSGSNKGNYGILEVSSDKVSGKVEFKYQKIEKKNEYYVMQENDKYTLNNDKFKKISNEFDFIELYDNYYVGINNNLLNVYEYDSIASILDKDLEVKDNKYKIDFEDGINITIDGTTYSYTKEGKIKDGE